MTALNYLTVASSLASIALAVSLIVRPGQLAWRIPVVRTVGAAMFLLSCLTLVLTLARSH